MSKFVSLSGASVHYGLLRIYMPISFVVKYFPIKQNNVFLKLGF